MNDIRLIREQKNNNDDLNYLYARLILADNMIPTEVGSTAGIYRSQATNCTVLFAGNSISPSTVKGIRIGSSENQVLNVKLYDPANNTQLLDRSFTTGVIPLDDSNTYSTPDKGIVIILNDSSYSDSDSVATCFISDFQDRLPLILDIEISSSDAIYIWGSRVYYNTTGGGKNGSTTGNYSQCSIVYDILEQSGDVTVQESANYNYYGLSKIYLGQGN